MRLRSSALFLLILLPVVHLSGPRAWAQPTSKDSASPAASDEKNADTLFLHGKSLFAEGKLEDAYKAYQTAFSFKKRYDIAGNLGNVAFELGKMREAAEYLTYCKMNFPPTGPAEVGAKLSKLLDEARKHVGTLSVTLRDRNCRVFVDGEPVSGQEMTPEHLEVFVEPGSHTIEVKRAGFKPTRKTIQAGAGSRQELDLEIPSDPETKSPIRAEFPGRGSGVAGNQPGDGVAAAQGETKSWKPWAIGGGIGLATVGVGLGIGFTVAAVGKEKDALALLDELRFATSSDRPICAVGAPDQNKATCDELSELLDQRNSARTVAIVGYALGGAAAIGTVLLAVLPRKAASPASGMRITPVVSSGQSGMLITGSF
jgi:tetratricopeptide (TPR) repeat protein